MRTSDLADAQADLSLRWVHMPFCWFCHAAAHLFVSTSLNNETSISGEILTAPVGLPIEPRHEKSCSCHMRTTKAMFSFNKITRNTLMLLTILLSQMSVL